MASERREVRASERMALTLVAMAVASLLVGKTISSELSVATEARRDFTVHSHDKKVKIRKSFSQVYKNFCI